MATNQLTGLRARVTAALHEVSHLRALTADPDTLGELAGIQRLLAEIATHFADGAADSPEGIDVALAAARRQLHAIHNAVALAARK